MAEQNRKNLIGFILDTYPVSPYAADTIAQNFDPVEFGKGDFLLTEGRVNNDYLFLEQGIMRSFAYDTRGNDVTTDFFVAPQMVFEVSSYFQRKPSSESIQAVTACRGWIGGQERFQHLFHSLPEFREFGRAILVKGFVSLKERMLSMITHKAEERYEVLLAIHPEIFQRVPLKFIASYLGITDTSLSRIRKVSSKK